MDYLSDLQRIEKALLTLDNAAYDTIEEAKNCLIKYDNLKYEIILIIRQVIENFGVSFETKEKVYKDAIRILIDHIGSTDDIQKYGSILESFHKENKLTEQQLRLFYDNLEIGRWR